MFVSGFVVASANAAPLIKLRSCFEDGGGTMESSYGWYPYDDDLPLRTLRACPRELGFETVEPVPLGTSLTLSHSTGQLNAKSVSFRISAGETVPGLTYEVEQCATGCTTIGRIEARLVADVAETVTYSLDGNPTVLKITATCESAVCPVGRGLTFNNIEFDLIDVEPPTVFISVSPSAGNLSWGKPGDFAVSLGANEHGIGLAHVYSTIDGEATPFWYRYGCDLSNSPVVFVSPWPGRSCPIDESLSYDAPLDVRGLADGLHHVKIDARDAVGNRSVPASSGFLLDGTPPDGPMDVVVESLNADGWTSDTRTKLFWKNGSEVRRTEVSSGLSAGYVDFEPRSGQAEDPPPNSFGPAGPNGDWAGPFTIPGDGEWDLLVWLEDHAGNLSTRTKIKVGRDVDTPPSPQLDALPWLNRSTLARGYNLSGVQPLGADIESGICGYAAAFNSSEISTPPPKNTHRGPISNIRIPADLPAGLSFAHLRAMSCSGMASPVATTKLRVDDRPPDVILTSNAIGDWSRSPLAVKVTGADDRSGLASIRYRVGGGAPQEIANEGAALSLAEGHNDLKVWAIDRAGNESQPVTRQFDIDLTPPQGGFLSMDRLRPSIVRAMVSDSLSGVAAAQIQYRRIDLTDDTWHGLPTVATPAERETSSSLLTAELPDSKLADGNYALRISVTDVAGNETSLEEAIAEDRPFRLTLPLRERSTVTADTTVRVSTKCTKKQRRNKKSGCFRRSTSLRTRLKQLVDFHDVVTLTGDLRDEEGQPRPGRRLKIYSTVKGHASELIAEETTDVNGRYAFSLPSGPTRRLSVVFAGDERTLSARAGTDLRVRGAATLEAQPKAVSVGRTVRFRGRLTSGDRWLPDVGKLIELQFKNGNNWQPGLGSAWALPGEKGRFRASYAFRVPRNSTTRIKVRALVRHESAWPFEDGVSNTVTLKLRP